MHGAHPPLLVDEAALARRPGGRPAQRRQEVASRAPHPPRALAAHRDGLDVGRLERAQGHAPRVHRYARLPLARAEAQAAAHQRHHQRHAGRVRRRAPRRARRGARSLLLDLHALPVHRTLRDRHARRRGDGAQGAQRPHLRVAHVEGQGCALQDPHRGAARRDGRWRRRLPRARPRQERPRRPFLRRHPVLPPVARQRPLLVPRTR